MTERPFIPRPPGLPAWWCRPATAEEFEAVEKQRREREILSGIRSNKEHDHG